MTVAYVDASALTKLILAEPDSVAMRRWYVESERVLCSRIGIVEIRRAVARQDHDPIHLDTIVASVEIIEFDASIARSAAIVPPRGLKTLDAVHLASALAIADEVDAFVTYDLRLAEAARAAGFPVVMPAA
jgi:predicted nucleic acid-binding protein